MNAYGNPWVTSERPQFLLPGGVGGAGGFVDHEFAVLAVEEEVGDAFDVHHVGESLVADNPLVAVHVELVHFLLPVCALRVQGDADECDVPAAQFLFQLLEVGDFRHAGTAP